MADGIRVVEDNRDEVIDDINFALERALEAVGLVAEGDVKKMVPVDTGLLRNSITHAVSGHEVANKTYHANNTHATTEATKKRGTAGKQQSAVRIGRYEGGAVESASGQKVVIIGTNVEYAPYVELGTSSQKAQPFLAPTLQNNNQKYQRILREYLANNI